MKNTNTKITVTNKITATPIFNGVVGQDGAIYGDFMFRFENDATCTVYSLSERSVIAAFTLHKADIIKPHCNTVCFGSERFSEDDEFPLLYVNVYNNYAKEADRLEGVCCVYRIMRTADGFSSTLVQLIRIGFTDDLSLWKSLPDNGDKRPYGNFIPDVTNGKLYTLTMRDKEKVTRCFVFDLPKLSEGMPDKKYGVNTVILNVSDIRSQFDFEYQYFIQGGCGYDGLLYSLEGGTVNRPDFPYIPKLKIIDTNEKKLLADIDLPAAGLTIEPELIDFAGDALYYMDSSGAVYTVEFC